MENYNNTNNQNCLPNKLKTNSFLIMIVVFTCFLLFGIGGYYFSMRSLNNSNKPKQIQTVSSPTTMSNNEVINLKTYKNNQYQIEFDYPQNYVISANQTNSTNPNYVSCTGLTDNPTGCLLSLTLTPNNNDYTPKAHFWLLKGINFVNILGQSNTISYDWQRKAWIVKSPISASEVLSVWAYTKSGQEIIKSSNGGSHGSSYYYIIPNYNDDQVAIFSFPESYRLRCDDLINNKIKENDCNNFYKSVIDQYNNEEMTVDTWLPENYLKTIYAEAENIAKSYREIAR